MKASEESGDQRNAKMRGEIGAKELDGDVVQVLSNYFRKYVKHSDAVPSDLDALIRCKPLFSSVILTSLTRNYFLQ